MRWEPRPGVFVDLVECDVDEANDGAALFKTVEAFRGAFFFSTSVELKIKDAEGEGAGCQMMDSDTSLPSILTLKHFWLFLRSVLTDRILPVLVFQASSWHTIVAERFV